MKSDLSSELLSAFERFEQFVSPAYVQYLIARDDIPLFLEQYPLFEALAAQWIIPQGSPLYSAFSASRPEVKYPTGVFVMAYLSHIAKTQPGERIQHDPLFIPTVQ